MTIEELKVIISAETATFQRAINGVKKSVNSLTNVVKNTTSKMTSYFTSSATRITSAFSTVTKTIARIVSAGMIVKLGKQAIELASNLEEVQNVVDVAFGEMASEAEYFAKKCAAAFGLSELSAKEYSSSFMTMSNSMGVASGAAKTMALQVAALTGDMASFYNTTQDIAYTALKSIWTGETETLKKFGVVMTEANLKAYALSQGITKSYTAMSQAEKVALRYNYVMSVTAQAQGDFTRTSNSWANQLRILQMQWQSLMSTMGSFLTQILVPIIKALNTIISLIAGAVDAFGELFGLSKTAADMSEISDSASSISDGLEEADESASKLKKTLAGFDELEVLQDNSSSSSSSSAAIDFDLLEPYDFSEIANQEKAQTTLKSLINDFNNFLEEIDKKFVAARSKFAKLGESFADSLNSLFDGIKWGLLGTTIANGLNNIIELTKSFRERLDALQIGQSIAEFFNGMFDTINWDGLGDAFIAKVNNLFDGIGGFITTLDVSQYATRVNTFLTKMIENVNYENIANTIAEVVNKAFSVAFEIVKSGKAKDLAVKLLDTINEIIGKIDWKQIGQTIIGALTQLFQALKDSDFPYNAGKAIKEALDGIKLKDILNDFFAGMGGALGNLIEGLLGKDIDTTNWDVIATNFLKVAAAISVIMPVVTPLIEGIATLRLAFGNFGTEGKNLTDIFSGIGASIANLGLSMEGDLFGGAFDSFSHLSKYGVSFFRDIDKAFDTSATGFLSWTGFFNNIGDLIKGGLSSGLTSVKGFASKFTSLLSIDSIKNVFSTLGGAIKGFFSSSLAPIVAIAAAVVLLIQRFVELYNNNEEFRAQVQEVWGRFKEAVANVWNSLQPLWETLKEVWGFIVEAWETIKPSVNAVLDIIIQVILQIIDITASLWNQLAPLIETILNVLKSIVEFLTPIIEAIFALVAAITEFLIPIISKVLEVAVAVIGTILTGIIDFVTSGIEHVSKFVSRVTTALTNFSTKVKNIIKGVKDFFKNAVNSIIGWVQNAINNIINKFNSSGLIRGINKILGTSIQLNTISIPKLANGGVFDSATLAIVGEESSKANQEIVTPQALLEQIVNTGNEQLAGAMIQIGRQIIGAIEGKDMEVTLDGTSIAKSVSKANNNYKLRTGVALI